jgi:hypothetical protein
MASVRVAMAKLTAPPLPAIRAAQAKLVVPGSTAPPGLIEVSQVSLTTPAPAGGGTALVTRARLVVPEAAGQQPVSGLLARRGDNLAAVTTRTWRGGEP